MTDDITTDLAAIGAALEAGPTPGPWRWEINRAHKSVHIVGGRPTFDKTVMDFERWGMFGAAPRFNEAIAGNQYNVMTRVSDRTDWIVPFDRREHHSDWCADITHPDARWMVECHPARMALILADHARLTAERDSLRSELVNQTAAAEMARGALVLCQAERDRLAKEVGELLAERDSLRDALAALVPVVESINGELSESAWNALEMARHVLGRKEANHG